MIFGQAQPTEWRFLSLASGSSGNCYYVGTPECGILFDAGIACRSIKKILRDHRIEMEQVMAVFITHDHADHIKSAGCLGEKYGIPVYATQAVHEGINGSRYIDAPLTASRRILRKGEPVTIRDFRITAFEVPHDATDCVGYRVQYGDDTLVLATDVGRIDDTVKQYIGSANHLILEANYDREMLMNGRYPAFLKERITNGNGHLCNTETAEFLATNCRSHLRNIWLCHLSRDNNHPELACKTVERAFGRQGVPQHVKITALKRNTPSELYLLN
ncbi:MAG: MBL fold metallo-hydrolase [Dysgonamonadaceae bacterium]|jgi:phosphoribosyl 1,2-cyclic phosphodiesterase|nr:MBL fold metallo-hydrolase [Dysgonamonadaceae bacterium]